VLDSFYTDADGRIANEFYLVVDSEEGELKRIQDPIVKRIEDPR
jgi:hypothetical protein